MNSIEEAIKHCEEVATENVKTKDCIECAEEHRQPAEWLKELKELRDFATFVAESVMEEDFEEDSDFYAEIFCRKLYKMGYIENVDGKWIFNDEEVNTDANSD